MLPGIKNDLKVLRDSLLKIINMELIDGNFDKEEYEDAKKSFYYRHIKLDLNE